MELASDLGKFNTHNWCSIHEQTHTSCFLTIKPKLNLIYPEYIRWPFKLVTIILLMWRSSLVVGSSAMVTMIFLLCLTNILYLIEGDLQFCISEAEPIGWRQCVKPACECLAVLMEGMVGSEKNVGLSMDMHGVGRVPDYFLVQLNERNWIGFFWKIWSQIVVIDWTLKYICTVRGIALLWLSFCESFLVQEVKTVGLPS